MSIKNVIRYWRDSLLDADLSALELTEDNHIRISEDVLRSGKLDSVTTKALFMKVSRAAADAEPDSDVEVRLIPVVIAPIVAVKKRSHAYGRRRVVLPVLVPALLNNGGYLEADADNSIPWIPRTLLEPTNSNLVLGSIDDLTSYLDANEAADSADPRAAWRILNAFTREMFADVADSQWRETFAVAGYRIEEKAALLPISVLRGISTNIIKVYDELIETGTHPPLLKTYARLNPEIAKAPIEEEDWDRPAKLHLGSFSNEFPLSSSQRQALYHFLTLPQNTVLAISGPPGTGKTTLLHSVIASLWIEAALDGEPPPVIVASSTNNQAVTNVIDSLSGSGNIKRWIDVSGFGLYLVNSQAKTRDAEERDILTVSNRGEGFPQDAQSEEFVESAYSDFITNCEAYFDRSFSNLDEAVKTLHAELTLTARALRDGFRHASDCRRVQASCDALVKEYGSLDQVVETQEKLLANAQADMVRWHKSAELWKESQAEGASLLSRLKFLPSVKQKQQERRQAFLAEHLPEQNPDSAAKDVTDYINGELISARDQVDCLQEEVNKIKQLSGKLDQVENNWLTWRKKHDALELEVDQLLVLENANGSANEACLHNWLDTNLRYKLFILATHYWEGRWLQTVIQNIIAKPNYREFRNQVIQEAKWRRYAMLTPCFVTTMHSGPGFFDYYEGEPHPLLDFVDLLIVDEAGQVTPEVSGGMFALAKQALVVGDIQQIEPVWSVPQQVDRGNLQRSGLLNSPAQWEALHRKGMMAGSGSVMQMAQSVSPYQLPSDDGGRYERGMFLAEHRRCVPEVIAYCNELAYQGRLRPMRPSVKDYPWPHIGYAHVKGTSRKERGSRKNEREAQAIVSWIVENKARLESYYSEKEGEKKEKKVKIENIVGIVTPFAAQKRTIQSMLKKNKISLSKVGTVHALQGGERPLVLFSPVYCSRDSGGYFFDQGPNMLNVAVSRAKDSFLVFGDMDILDPELKTPSGILARYLFAEEGNEIAGVTLPARTENEFESKDLFLVNTLKNHVRTLSKAFEKAEKQLVIVSPYLRWRAVEADEVARNTAAAVGRGVKVTIYVDDSFNNRLELPSAAKAAAALQDKGAEIKLCHNIHSKIICIDNDIFVEGSFNWLSAERVQNEHVRHETSMIYMGPQASDFIGDTIRDIETAVIG